MRPPNFIDYDMETQRGEVMSQRSWIRELAVEMGLLTPNAMYFPPPCPFSVFTPPQAHSSHSSSEPRSSGVSSYLAIEITRAMGEYTMLVEAATLP